MSNSVVDPDEDELDPRIKIELDNLNTATDEINRLEIQLDEANAQFRAALTESTQRLKELSSKLGKCINEARPYYDAVDVAKKAQIECQNAAVQFQRAVSLHSTAKETIMLAEQRFLSRQDEGQFDTTWQEMLNHATAKVLEADKRRSESETEHRYRALMFAKAEQTVQQLEQKLRSAINKSKPYFEARNAFHRDIQILKERVAGLQKTVSKTKEQYAKSLKNLEIISEEIHQSRNLKLIREPGVGAENVQINCIDNETSIK
ncbi:hypothetical protein CHUAL_013921 [Chamberlinius hualienensis]